MNLPKQVRRYSLIKNHKFLHRWAFPMTQIRTNRMFIPRFVLFLEHTIYTSVHAASFFELSTHALINFTPATPSSRDGKS